MKKNMKHNMLAAALFVAAALPTQLAAQSERPVRQAEANTITVEVYNGNWLDMRIYAVRENGASDRIGTVTSFSARELELPRWLVAANAAVQLVAVPIGSTQRYAAQPVVVSNGDVIEWKLSNHLSLSSIFVRAAG